MANCTLELTRDAQIEFSWKTYLPAILIAGLGFLVDVYDVLLFAVLRVPSLHELGVAAPQMLQTGVNLMNMQMLGLIAGGVVWGMVGDRKGRKAALFGSILVYSIATLLNGMVTSVEQYAALRFIAGFGLAGEVGAAMTIAAEMTPARYRTLGTAAVSFMGVLGSVLAAYTAEATTWRNAFYIAGAAGLALLCIRIKMKESRLFETAKKRADAAGMTGSSLAILLLSLTRLLKISRLVLAALPLFFVFGVLVTFSPEIKASQADAAGLVARVAIFYSIGEILGETASGIMSQLVRSRKRVMIGFQIVGLIVCLYTLQAPAEQYALLCLPLGFCVGYWALVITTASEQFGTNVRSSVTTIVPNLMRASHIPINLLFAWLATTFGISQTLLAMTLGAYALAFISVIGMQETAGKDLDFLEQ